MDKYVELARQAVEEYIKKRRRIEVPQNLPPEFYFKKAGVFVTIHKSKELRGCIGTYMPTKENIAEEIISNALAACSKDYRFHPITKDELPNLNYEVSILSEPEPLKEIEKHNPKKHGIIVRCADGRCGLLLPDLDGVDSMNQQILVAARKGGIDIYLDDIQLYYFTVEKHKQKSEEK